MGRVVGLVALLVAPLLSVSSGPVPGERQKAVLHGVPPVVTVFEDENNEVFFENNNREYTFECEVNGTSGSADVKWVFVWGNGSVSEILDIVDKKNRTDGLCYSESASFFIPSTHITRVGCEALGYSVSGFLSVNVTTAVKPRILNERSPGVLKFSEQKTLKCVAEGTNLQFVWLKNGLDFPNKEESTTFGEVSEGTLALNPSLSDGDHATYTCKVYNFLGEDDLDFYVQLMPDAQVAAWPFILLLTAVVLGATVIGYAFLKHRASALPAMSQKEIDEFKKGVDGEEGSSGDVELDAINAPFDAQKEIRLEWIVIRRKLGSGQFGVVESAYLLVGERKVPVVVKSPREDTSCKDLMKETKLMQGLGSHPHLVEYLGAVVEDELLRKHKMYLVLEHCFGGDVGSYLKDKWVGSFHDNVRREYCNFNGEAGSKNDPLRLSLLVRWCRDIADGMDYLTSRGFIHRDLAARNVLLAYEEHPDLMSPSPGDFVVKIADFGLSRKVREEHEPDKTYYTMIVNALNREKRMKENLPWTGMAPEAIASLKFTAKNDVWAFGVTMWEIFTFNESPPYTTEIEDWGREGVDTKDRTVLMDTFRGYLQDGNTLERPLVVPNEIWEIMRSCWRLDKNQRPSFAELRGELGAFYDGVSDSECSCFGPPEPLPPNYSQMGQLQQMSGDATGTTEMSLSTYSQVDQLPQISGECSGREESVQGNYLPIDQLQQVAGNGETSADLTEQISMQVFTR